MQTQPENRRLVKFIVAAVVFFAWCCIQGIVMEQASVREFLEAGGPLAGMIKGVHAHVGCSWTGLGLMGAIYYLVPIFSGKSIAWQRLINWVFWISVAGMAVSSAMMLTAGIIGGNAFVAGITEEAELMGVVMPYFIAMSLGAYVAVIGAVMFVVQILVTLARGSKATS